MNEINPKIANINKVSSIEPDTKQKKSPQKTDCSFNEILTNQIKKSGQTTILKKTGSLLELESTFKTQQLNLMLDQSQVAQKFTETLNLLETYASWLGDPDKTLKQTAGLLEQVSGQAKTLAQEIKEETGSNPELKQLLTQMMTTIAVEQVKFNRGDYSS
ncbi:MAG: hypothetical protein KKE44_24415 [Proteobacteria bacterium]|nr:hypothetical protein [Pseudomonadota bacterium]MBU1585877.1 hypothetical protein [Pseudomonadota bacterium]MBU2454036.1 hypothetical protein [Pseudomonadota bacterium]MBU2627966.1 hypothetical protein [Pseudomonadota bacterium]